MRMCVVFHRSRAACAAGGHPQTRLYSMRVGRNHRCLYLLHDRCTTAEFTVQYCASNWAEPRKPYTCRSLAAHVAGVLPRKQVVRKLEEARQLLLLAAHMLPCNLIPKPLRRLAAPGIAAAGVGCHGVWLDDAAAGEASVLQACSLQALQEAHLRRNATCNAGVVAVINALQAVRESAVGGCIEKRRSSGKQRCQQIPGSAD